MKKKKKRRKKGMEEWRKEGGKPSLQTSEADQGAELGGTLTREPLQ